MEKKCLSCKNYRPVDELSGRCRVDRATTTLKDYPVMKHDDSCERWLDAGQQYYIRVGWLKAQSKKKAEQN